MLRRVNSPVMVASNPKIEVKCEVTSTPVDPVVEITYGVLRALVCALVCALMRSLVRAAVRSFVHSLVVRALDKSMHCHAAIPPTTKRRSTHYHIEPQLATITSHTPPATATPTTAMKNTTTQSPLPPPITGHSAQHPTRKMHARTCAHTQHGKRNDLAPSRCPQSTTQRRSTV